MNACAGSTEECRPVEEFWSLLFFVDLTQDLRRGFVWLGLLAVPKKVGSSLLTNWVLPGLGAFRRILAFYCCCGMCENFASHMCMAYAVVFGNGYHGAGLKPG